MAGFDGFAEATLRWGNTVKSVTGYAVTGNYFDLLGVQPEVGRFIHEADEHGPNSAPYVVLSDQLWRSAFNADPAVVGTTVRLDKDPYTVIGVAPAHFHGTEQFDWPDYWVPFVNWDQQFLQSRTSITVTVLGRLKPGVTPQQAAENLSAIAAQLAKEYPQTDTGMPLRLVRPGLYADDGDVIRGFLYSVTGLALLVLAAACANLASLFAARASDRSRELALRVALGANRWRLVRQLMTEAMVLSILGGAAGLLIAGLLLRVLNRWQFALRSSGSQRGCACLSGSSELDLIKRPAVWDDSGAAGLAEQSVAGDEERTSRFDAAAPVCVAGPVAGRTNCNLHAAGNGLACCRARNGALASHSTGFPTTRRDVGRHGSEPGGTGRRRATREKESND